jgi:hypothetical protein
MRIGSVLSLGAAILASSTLFADVHFRCDSSNQNTHCLFSVNDGKSINSFAVDPGQTHALNDHCVSVVPNGATTILNWPACWGNSGYRRVRVVINTQ